MPVIPRHRHPANQLRYDQGTVIVIIWIGVNVLAFPHRWEILISRSGGTAEEAFASLRTISQHEHHKLAGVARHVVEEAARRARARHANP